MFLLKFFVPPVIYFLDFFKIFPPPNACSSHTSSIIIREARVIHFLIRSTGHLYQGGLIKKDAISKRDSIDFISFYQLTSKFHQT